MKKKISEIEEEQRKMISKWELEVSQKELQIENNKALQSARNDLEIKWNQEIQEKKRYFIIIAEK